MTGSAYATFEQPVRMYRGETMAGIIADEAKHDTSRGFAGGYYMETLSLGPCRSWPRSSSRASGAGRSPRRWTRTSTRPGCGSSARTCRRRPTGSR